MFKYLGKKLRNLFGGKIDEEVLEKVEELFYEADLGAQTSASLTDHVRTLYKKNSKISYEDILKEIKEQLIEKLGAQPTTSPTTSPHVILIVGVNGNGKTTSIAKLAHHYAQLGKSVLVAAADTFRAAAIDQLELWSQKLNIEIVKGAPGSDPASVAFDAITAAKSRGIDIVLIDTAGRLHTKSDLMQELEKICRVCGKALPDAPHETLLVLDATIGQNGVEQALIFHKFTPLSGLILTKLDGTAKGGTAIALQAKLNLPIKFIGVGESATDLRPFQPKQFIDDLLS
ncbi:MAG: Signal recognition particle receptor FtsY [Chlamydiales bacterium]|nr:Signal recognition particle receptor FtsY [Chlamydiales bacterium]MCH9620549.1 Signal recognition particle receptor FtsY [Chlamydiales bacterium]MCH9623003.1 Signal recognition particle receptor FtsY [Chlamydiales bacterium]